MVQKKNSNSRDDDILIQRKKKQLDILLVLPARPIMDHILKKQMTQTMTDAGVSLIASRNED